MTERLVSPAGGRPQRIQRKRTAGWRMPFGAISVTRPGRWGNPFKIGRDGDAQQCVTQFRTWITSFPALVDRVRRELRGYDLVCWCAADAPWCHADVLLEVANG